MDFKRMMAFFIAAILILMGWEYLFPTPKVAQASQEAVQQQAAAQNGENSVASKQENPLSKTDPILVNTDVVQATIDAKTGDLRQLVLLKHNSVSDENKQFVLLDDSAKSEYIVQSDLLTEAGQYLLRDVTFSTAQKSYTLTGDQLEVRLSAPEKEGVQVDKVYTFQRGSYLINVRFDIHNNNQQPVRLDGVYRVLRNSADPDGSGYFDHTYHGPVLYTPEGKFEKVSFKQLDQDFTSGQNQAEYVHKTSTGWIGMTQHYFTTAWILQPKAGESVCRTGACQVDIRRRNDSLYSAGVRVPFSTLEPNTTQSFSMELYAGPQTYAVIAQVADNFQLVKDYGKVHIFAAPLFWLLNKLHTIVGNWGWAIILLTIIVKAVFYPLTAASYRSMAKMRALSPRLQSLKEAYGDDRMKMQQAMMQLYKEEKINPLGGCLPMVIQIPVFIGLYWALFSSVELRQAPWIGWIQDLGRADPYYILPILMAITMFIQTSLNPPPADPMQAKMMKIIPIVFSVMFFFFPAGLVLYWLSNNVLTIMQQWYVNQTIAQQKKEHPYARD